MSRTLPLFARSELDAIKRQREHLQRLLKRGGVDAHSRIRREQKLAILTAQQSQIERRLGIGDQRP